MLIISIKTILKVKINKVKSILGMQLNLNSKLENIDDFYIKMKNELK